MGTPRAESYQHAVRLAAQRLAGADLRARFSLLGIEYRDTGDSLEFSAFGKKFSISVPDLGLQYLDDPAPADITERILLLHFFCHDAALTGQSEPISFRDLPGGIFYFRPFAARSVLPLTRRIGSDLALLREGLAQFQWSPFDAGDLGAKIKIAGDLHLYLVYWVGDEEFPPDAEVLFDGCIKNFYTTEDAAVLAAHVCRLLRGR